MATIAAAKIAAPIIDGEIDKHVKGYFSKLTGAIGNESVVRDRAMLSLDHKRIGGLVRVALNEKAHPVVVEDWAHEAKRRVGMAAARASRRLSQGQRAAADRKRRERISFEKKRRQRHQQKKGAMGKIFSAVRKFFKSARGE